MLFCNAISLLSIVTFAAAAPLVAKSADCLTAQDLISIASDTSSCDGADFPSECANATAAGPAIANSFTRFQIDSFGAQAALVALMLFESGDFKYNQNHFPAPGVPGQGTRNMQSPTFNQKYAEWAAANWENVGFTSADVQQAEATGPAAVLALVQPDKTSFASAAWFLTTQCDASVKEALAANTEAAFSSYITDCVGTTATEDRISGWQKVSALGSW